MRRGHVVAAVHQDSPAHRMGLAVGDRVIKINRSYFYDLLDYHYLSASEQIELHILKKNGTPMRRLINKAYDENLGLEFSSPTIGPLRRCQNNCIFCFIDQQPACLRSSLYEKDDDYRLSFFHGNYITLTNVAEGELKRIARRYISPLYISIHATDPVVRSAMMGNRTAAKITDQLGMLAKAGITMHGQVVVCPGYNDGIVLQKTIGELVQFYPYLKTVALVPVGLTRYRNGLTPLRPFTAATAGEIVETCSRRQLNFTEKWGTPFVYLADEFYLLANLPLPEHTHYGAYEQIENGVGLLRLFLNELDAWKKQPVPRIFPEKNISLVTGEAAGPFLNIFMQHLKLIPGLKSHLHLLPNLFWGGNVNAAGLLCGQDLLQGLTGKPLGEALFIPAVMLKEGTELFLDSLSVTDLSFALKVPVLPVRSLQDICFFLEGKINSI